MIYIEVKVIPNSARNQIVGYKEGVLKVRVNAPPEKGRANKEFIAFLAKKLSLDKRNIVIVRGVSGKNKRIAIDCDEEKLRRLF